MTSPNKWLHECIDIKNDVKVIYGTNRFCPKCSSTTHRVRWHKDKFRTYSNKKTCEKYDEAQTEDEHLHYYCETCLYDWTEPIKGASNRAS